MSFIFLSSGEIVDVLMTLGGIMVLLLFIWLWNKGRLPRAVPPIGANPDTRKTKTMIVRSARLSVPDLWEAHRRALDQACSCASPPNLLPRAHETLYRAAERDFYAALEDRDRPGLTIELSSHESAGTSIERLLLHLAKRGVPALSVERKEGGGRFGPEGDEQLDRLCQKLRMRAEEKKKIADALLSHVASIGSADVDRVALQLAFVSHGKGRGRLPIDILILPEEMHGRPQIAHAVTREGWLLSLGLLPARDAPVRFTIHMPGVTFSFLPADKDSMPTARDKRRTSSSARQVLMTPHGVLADDTLRYIYEARALGYSVRCVLKQENVPGAIEMAVARARPRFQGECHGIYFARGQEFDPRPLARHPSSSNPPILNSFQVNAELFWIDSVTHFITPTQNEAIHRFAYSIPERKLPKALKAICEAAPQSEEETGMWPPLIEAKTALYRYYVDIDLPWELLNLCGPLAELKKAQLSFFNGGGDSAYEVLTALVTAAYPPARGSEPRALISRRTGSTERKNGHHVIFPDVLLPNDGHQGLILTGQLEIAAAHALNKSQHHPLMRFLLRMLLDDWQHLGRAGAPLTFRIRPFAPLLAAKLKDAAELLRLCSEGMSFSLRDEGVLLSEEENAQLVRFALSSMSPKSVENHLRQIVSAPTNAARARSLNSLARRCRWEILQRARFFDHSV